MPAPSPRLQEFLRQRLSSLEHIDVVLLLRQHRDRSWTAPEVAAALATAPETSAMRLFLLASGGLIAFEPASVPRYRYAASDPEVDELLGELERVDRAELAALIATAPADPVRSFADAFKLKK